MKKPPDKFETISELAKRRGFFWPSYEIYGGVRGFVTFGHLGTLLKHRIEEKFRRLFVRRFSLLEIESSVITPSKVFEASGHVDHFKEPMVECSSCKRKFRADHLIRENTSMNDTETEKLSLSGLQMEINRSKIKCPECDGKLGVPRYFTTMFVTTIGPYSEAVGYGRPEAAQGIFVEFRRLYECARERMPFGVVQIGHALRNEISPRQGPIRLREFTIIDVEFFFDPEDPHCQYLKEVEGEVLRLIPAAVRAKGKKEKFLRVTVREALQRGYIKTEWQAFFMALAKRFLSELGVPPEKQRFIEKLQWERAHYSAQGYDQEIYLDRWGWVEVSGHNYRTDYDLRRHMECSGIDMRVFTEYEKPIIKEKIIAEPVESKIKETFKEESLKVAQLIRGANPIEIKEVFENQDFYKIGSYKLSKEHVKIVRKKVEEKGRRFIPNVVEPSFGEDRIAYAALEYAFNKKGKRTLLSFPREVSPVQATVFPLVNKNGLNEKARDIYIMLLDEGFTIEYDDSGSIGRRYARADEIGTPLSITVDYQSLKDNTITIRDRDTWNQVRTEEKKLPELLRKYFQGQTDFEDFGVSFG